jgi:glycosyltransferase involved in cell wall biosynthesis
MKVLAISPFLWTMGRQSGVPTLYRTLQEFGRHGEVRLLLPAHDARVETDGRIQVETFRLPGWTRLGPFGPERSIFSLPFPGGRLGRYLLDKVLWLHFSLAAFRQGWRMNRRFDADVFYGVAPAGAAAAFLLRLAARGVNVTRLLGTFLTPLADSARAGQGRLRRFLRALPHFPEVLAFFLPAAAVVVTDDGTRGDEVARALGARPVYCWRNGLDVPEERGPAAGEVPSQGPVAALYVGQLVRWKRVDRLLAALRDGRSALEGWLVLTIVGDGPERPALEALAGRLEVAQMVHFAGAVARDQLRAYHRAADIFVCAHDLTCACNATLEAMAAGLPVLATNVGHTSEILTHGREGLLVDAARPEELAAALTLLVDDPRRRAEMGRQARDRVAREFGSWRQRGGREYALVRRLLGSAAPEGAPEPC